MRYETSPSDPASQGPLIVLFGTLGPWIAANDTWRWIYWSTSISGIAAWLLLIGFVPETRKTRSTAELGTDAHSASLPVVTGGQYG